MGDRPVMLAPMEDVTDAPFRSLCRRMGAAMVYSEFVSSDALIRMVNKSLAKLEIMPEERPVAIQIYGKDPGAMAEAAQIVVEQAHPDVLDMNFGCPVKKVAGKGAGAGLLRNIPLMLEIARRVVDAVDIPVTAKTRLGWDHNNIIITDLAESLQDTGIRALTIHGRTRSQVYNGEADWEPIRQVRSNPRMHIPIIGNGDITGGADVVRRFAETGVDGIMVARGDLGVEVPMEEVPSIQRRIIRYCQQNSKVVITATQMLDSMIHNPRPTRAEVTDVADAIVEGTSATMLSGETASGQYPVEACRVMGRIAERAEKDIDYHMQRRAILAQDRTEHNVTTAICHAAITVAEDTKAKAILAVTLSGATARALSRLRPPVPVLACTTSSRVACQLNLNYALIPLIINEEQNLDMLFNSAVDRAKMTGLLQKGDKIVLVAGYPLGQSGNTNMIRVVEVE